MKKLLIVLTVLASATVAAEDFEISHGTFQGNRYTIPYIKIVSLEDNTTINQVIVNRGNCRIAANNERSILHHQHGINDKLPRKMVYGTEIHLPMWGNCSIKEVVIVTDKEKTKFGG